MPKIAVTLCVDPYTQPLTVYAEIEESLYEHVFEDRISDVSPDSPAFLRMMSTPPEVVTVKKQLRRGVAKQLSTKLTEALIELMSHRDTMNGYGKEG